MPKLELDLYFRDKKYGNTSIMIDTKPQFSLHFYSARPHKIPLPMNTTSKTSEGGLPYIGPLQTEFGFISNNQYVVEVAASGASVGEVVSLRAMYKSPYPGVEDRPMENCTITAVDGGKVNATGRAEFTVSFGDYPTDPRSIFWLGFNWEITSQWGRYYDATPHALVYGGETFKNGLMRRLDPRYIDDATLLINPGTHGFWIDIFAVGGGGGLHWDTNDVQIGDEVPGKTGGSIPIYIASPLNNPCRYPQDVNQDARDCIPIAFVEGGQGYDLWDMMGEKDLSSKPGLAAQFLTTLAAEYSGKFDIRVEKLDLQDGLASVPQGPVSGKPYGGFDDLVRPLNGSPKVGQGIVWQATTPGVAWRSGCGGLGKFRIHVRRRAAAANIPLRAVNIRFKAAKVLNKKWHVPIVSPVKYATPKTPHVTIFANGSFDKIKNTEQLPSVTPVSADGGAGGYPQNHKNPWSMRSPNGGNGSLGIINFGYYTAFA